jgi:type II secretory pathway pseudopilin PulG
MLFRSLKQRKWAGFSLIELMVVLITASIMTGSMMNYFFRQQRMNSAHKIRADSENLGLIGYFMIGRDIRSAGCNPNGFAGGSIAAPVAVWESEQNKITLLCDRNGDGDINDPDEQITYDFSALDGRLVRNDGSGNEIAVDNVSTFDLAYSLQNDGINWFPNVGPAQRPLIDMVRVSLGVNGNMRNPATGNMMKERLYSTTFRIMNLQ